MRSVLNYDLNTIFRSEVPESERRLPVSLTVLRELHLFAHYISMRTDVIAALFHLDMICSIVHLEEAQLSNQLKFALNFSDPWQPTWVYVCNPSCLPHASLMPLFRNYYVSSFFALTPLSHRRATPTPRAYVQSKCAARTRFANYLIIFSPR